MGLMKAVREFDPQKDASFRTFAEVCIRNRMFSALRAASREKHRALNQSISMEAPFFDSNSYASVSGHAASVNPEELYILYLEGMTCGEIAQALNKPAKSVENAIQRIRRKAAR